MTSLPACLLFAALSAALEKSRREPEDTLHCCDCARWHRNPDGVGNRHYGKCDRMTRWTHEGSSCWKEEAE